MGIFDGCMLVSDIDGTLYTNGTIPQKNIEAIEKFKSLGGIFTIATGRGPAIGKAICRESHANAPVIMVNGSAIYDAENEKILYAEYLSDSAKQLIFEATRIFTDVGLEITLDDAVASINSTKSSSDYVNEIRSGEKYNRYNEKAENLLNLNVMKGLFMCLDENRLNELIDFFMKRLDGSFDYVRSSPVFFEILTPNAGKSKHFDKLSKITGVRPDKIFAIGDYYNDLKMIKDASIGACTAESPDDIKAQADYVTVGVKDGAVADFINYLENILERK